MRTVRAHKAILRGQVRYRVIEPATKVKPRVQRWFKTKELADAHADVVNSGRREHIEELFLLDRQSQSLLVESLRKAGSAQAVLEAVNSVGTPIQPKTLSDAIAALIQDRRDAERSDDYVRQMEWSLNKFAKGRENWPLNSITTEHIRAWLRDVGGSADARRVYIGRIRILFSFAMQPGNKWTRENPAKAVSTPTRTDKEPTIFAPKEVLKILTAAKSDREMLTYFALLFFAGPRPSEARRLKPENFRGNLIRVTAEIARKKNEIRNVPINPTLRRWLKIGEPVPVPANWRKRFAKIVAASGVKWKQDAARHSFVTYHNELHGWQETVKIAGHSLAMMVEHYNALTTKAEARKFWGLKP